VRLLIIALALAPIGCTSPVGESIFDYQTPVYDGGGTTSANPTPRPSIDATPCEVQGSASVSGSLGGATLAAKDAVEIFDPTRARFTFLVTDYASACSATGASRAGSNVISIVYDHPTIASGTYDVAKTEGLHVAFTRRDGTCHTSDSATAASGTITFDRLDDCGGAGSFDLVFGSNHVTATFVASVCAMPTSSTACE
jgi:hypothetical protein